MNIIDPYLHSAACFIWGYENKYRAGAYHMRLFAIRQNSSVLMLGQKTYELPPESIAIFRPGVFYDLRNKEESQRVKLYCCNFDLVRPGPDEAEFLAPVIEPHFRKENIVECTSLYALPEYAALLEPIVISDCPDLCDKVCEIYLSSLENGEYSAEIGSSLLKYVVLTALKRNRTASDYDQFPTYAVAAKALAYIREHFSEPINEKTIAAAIRYHPYYLTRLTKQYFGTTPYRYLMKCRCDYGIFLLQRTTLPIQEIAISCGFSSQAHFSSVIRKELGIPPSEVRKNSTAIPSAAL